METVLDALKHMGKATFREVAARMEIEPTEALDMLREQRELGLCDFGEGGWSLTGEASLSTATESSKSVTPRNNGPLRGEPVVSVSPDTVVQLLRQHGAMDTASIADRVNRNARGMVSAMRSLERQGVVVKNGQGKGVTWSLPTSAATPPVKAEDTTAKSTAEIISDIPAFAPRPEVMAIPTPAGLTKEIRRTEMKLAGLKKLRGAVRELHRNKHLLEHLR